MQYKLATFRLKFMAVSALLAILIISSKPAYSQWEKCKGTYSTLSVYNIVEINSSFMASTQEGIITSKDGITWDGLIEFSYPINDLCYQNNTLFAVFGYNALKVSYSKDRGETWEMLNTDTLRSITSSLYSLLFDKGTIYLATGKGIFRTDNWGESWELVTNKIIGNHIIHTKLIKAGETYFAIDKNKDIFLSKDYGKNWKKSVAENINAYRFFVKKGELYGLKDEKILAKYNENDKWETYFDKEFGYVSVAKPFCCNGFFISSDKNRIAFSKDNIIELPKIPINREFDLIQEVCITPKYIIVSVLEKGLWYIPYKLNVEF